MATKQENPTTIHLGYELVTGKEVSIPLRHLAVTGQTQEAGKTTTLEALISRSKLRALTFITKRGEGAFQDAPRIPAYFRERADWQYVSAILEATLREKLKFERSWIMKVCKGARALADVQRNIERDLKTARGLNESVLTTLHAYLELVLPQITAGSFAPGIALKPGVNVMDLSDFRLELQSLIIRSALEWIYEREDQTIVIIPEAWEYIPQNRGSPVKLACEQLIRKGGGLRNYVWLDSQDIAALHKDILRSVAVWILGVQRERNEVRRMLDHLVGVAKPAVADVMQLGRGEFFVSFGTELRKVYVQPAWMDADAARAHALGGPLPKPQAKAPAAKDSGAKDREETMWKEKYEALKRDYNALAARLALEQVDPTSQINVGEVVGIPAANSGAPTGKLTELPAIYDYVKSRLLSEKDPGILALLSVRPELHVKVERPTVQLDDSTLRGRLARLVSEGYFDNPATGNSAFNELLRIGFRTSKPNVYKELDKLAEMGIVTKETNGFQKAPGAFIKKIGATG